MIKQTFCIILAILLLTTPCTAHSIQIVNSTTRTLEIEQAVQTAFQNRSTLKALKFATRVQTANKKEALTGYLPKLRFDSRTRLSKGVKGFRSIITFRGSQLLYSFSGPLDLYEIAKRDEQIAKQSERLFKDQLRNDVETTFLTNWLLQKKHRQADLQAHSARTTFERDKHQQDQLLLNKDTWLISNATYAKEVTTASLLEQDTATALSNLEQRIGITFHTKPLFRWNPRKRIHLQALTSYQQKALEHRKELQIKDLQIRRERRRERFHNKSYLPSITLAGDISRDDVVASPAIQGPTIISQTIGANVSWNIFDGMSAYRKGQAAHAAMMQLRMERLNIVTAIRDEVTTAYHQVRSLLKLLKAEIVQLTQAHNAFVLKKLEQDLGLIIQTDFDTARFAWENAKFTWFSLRVDTEITLKNLLFSCGQPERSLS